MNKCKDKTSKKIPVHGNRNLEKVIKLHMANVNYGYRLQCIMHIIYIYIFIYIFIYTYIYTYIHTHTHTLVTPGLKIRCWSLPRCCARVRTGFRICDSSIQQLPVKLSQFSKVVSNPILMPFG